MTRMGNELAGKDRFLIVEYTEQDGWFVGITDTDKTEIIRGLHWARQQGRTVVFVDTEPTLAEKFVTVRTDDLAKLYVDWCTEGPPDDDTLNAVLRLREAIYTADAGEVKTSPPPTDAHSDRDSNDVAGVGYPGDNWPESGGA